MITRANLFYNGFTAIRPNKDILLFRNKISWNPQITDNIHTVTTTDTIDSIAYQYYNRFIANAEKYWWVVADANKMMNPLDLSAYVGKTIRIPDISLLDFN